MTTNKCKNKRKEYYEKRKEKVNQRDGMCPLRPDNIGLKCENITDICCATCGWNPAVEEERRAKLRE